MTEISDPLIAVPAPPLVSLAEARSTAPSYGSSRFGVKTPHSPGSVSNAISPRQTEEGHSRDYSISDINVKECYGCASVFTIWTTKFCCGICGQSFCLRCASGVINGSRHTPDDLLRVCHLCFQNMAPDGSGDNDNSRPLRSIPAHPARRIRSASTSSTLSLPSAFATSQPSEGINDSLNLHYIPETRTAGVSKHGGGRVSLKRSWLASIRNGVQNRLANVTTGVPESHKIAEKTTDIQELNPESMSYLQTLLCQMLSCQKIHNTEEWAVILLRFARRAASEVMSAGPPQSQGKDMDIRRYVMIKKIPGGTPQDSEYLNGALITKNVADSRMSTLMNNPRVMLVTFPLELSQMQGQSMHFKQTVSMEHEHMVNLVSRIAALRPNVVLAEMGASRIALDAFAKHNITVARTVKASSIRNVARLTQGHIFSALHQLALEPRLGHCTQFRTQLYDHDLVPSSRKTYMRFEGCNPNMGCTIILRGGNIDTLRRIKKVARFLIFLVRNLKLEQEVAKTFTLS